MIFVLVLSIIFAFLEAGVFAFPLNLILLLCYVLVSKNENTLFIALLSGLIIDSLTLRAIGSTPFFLIVFLSIVLLYQRKFEITNTTFAAVLAFVGTLIYTISFGYQFVVLQSVLSVGITVVIFKLFTKFYHR